MKRIVAAVIAAAALFLSAGVADANPGPGNSHSCAPGHHGNHEPGFKPGACDN